MLKRIFFGLTGLLGLSGPAAAMTSSANCVAALKKATARHSAPMVPGDCWRMAYINLGMKRVSAEGVLGAPDTGRDYAIAYRGRKFPLHEALYVYPRNLKSWLRLAPQAADDFHPAVLHVIYWKDAVVAMTLNETARSNPQPCKPSRAARPFHRTGSDFPFDFHGIGLNAKLPAVQARFGRFAATNRSRDFFNYWPVPLSFGGGDAVMEISFASGMAFAHVAGMAKFQLRQDPATCLVTGFAVSPP